MSGRQLCFLGRSWGQVDYREANIGAVLNPSLAILWVMLKLSRATVGHLEAICHSAMLLDLRPKVVSPRSTKILSGFWQAMLDPFGGQMQGSKQHFGERKNASNEAAVEFSN